MSSSEKTSSSSSPRSRRAPTSPGRAQPLDSTGFTASDPIPISPRRRSSARKPTAAAALFDAPLLADDDELLEPYAANPRSFPHNVKQQCWEKAAKVKGRDPDRWRRDPLGNLVFRKLVGCPGCLCHDYDHIVPYSKVSFNLILINLFKSFL